MLPIDSLAHIGMAVLSLGTIHEEDGIREHTFWLRNAGTEAVTLKQGYTSCGCTTITFEQGKVLAVGDTTAVTLRFNPRGKGGEFLERGTIVYGEGRKRIDMTMEGECITSEETLLKQFPIHIDDTLRLSADRFDLGIMHVGETKERYVAILHREVVPRRESVKVRLTIDAKTPKGLQHIKYPLQIKHGKKTVTTHVMLDVLVK